MQLDITTRQKNILDKKGIQSYEDVLNFLPRKYIDYRTVYKSVNPQDNGKTGCFIGVLRQKDTNFEKNMSVIKGKMYMEDGTKVNIAWFGQYSLEKVIEASVDNEIAVYGQLKYDERWGYSIGNPEFFCDITEDGDKYLKYCKLRPVYKKFSGISDQAMRKLVVDALFNKGPYKFEEMNKEDELYCVEKNLPTTMDSYIQIHNPKDESSIELAQLKLDVNSLWSYAVKLAEKEQSASEETFVNIIKYDKLQTLKESLPYELTIDQKKYINEMISSLHKKERISALVQGDVGCGKTMVAIAMLVLMADNGYQGLICAPTDILAMQHFVEIESYCKMLGLTCAYMGGKVKASEKKSILKGLADGSINIIVGTQALCNASIDYKNLGITIIDEEHRFGVDQKAQITKMAEKGVNVLYMSATPIPRTMAGAIYGSSMKIYDIHSMPSNRKGVQTASCKNDETAFAFIEKQLTQGRQAYVVCPMIEANDESERMVGVESVDEVCEKLKNRFKPMFRVEKLTGKMKKEETDEIIKLFKEGIIHILVSTTVIEVGVNVPNASVIMINNAERFGLATMHQLRGRVGRGEFPGFCILKSKDEYNERIDTMVNHSSGFEIAENDLLLRGAGNLIGTEQSGYTKMLMLVMKYPQIYERIKVCAEKIVKTRK